jgi:hypothetical protein
MSEEFDCNGPGIGELMLGFDAALGPLAVGIELALNPDLAIDITSDWAVENLDAALAMMAPPVALALAMIDFVEVSISMPVMNISVTPFVTPGLPPVPGWGIPQMDALGMVSIGMVMVPIDIMIGLFEGNIDLSLPMIEIVTPLLPDIPGIEGLAGCVAERLEPIFGIA